MWLRHIWHWLRQWSIWLRQICPPRGLFFWPKFVYIFDQSFSYFTILTKTIFFFFNIFDQTFFDVLDETLKLFGFLTFLTKLLFFFFGQNIFFLFGENSFGELHLVKLHLANFIWRNFIWRTSFGVDWLRQSIPWLCQVLHWLRQWHWFFQTGGQTDKQTHTCSIIL